MSDQRMTLTKCRSCGEMMGWPVDEPVPDDEWCTECHRTRRAHRGGRVAYRTIFADPPWSVKAGTLKGREGWHDAHGTSRPLAYPSMTVDAIGALDVRGLAHPDGAHLYLCTINRYVADAYDVARAWGFEPSTLLVWAKATMGGGLGGTYGISTEYVLFARRGKCAARRREPRTWWNWKRPYDERGKPRHSAKPPELYRMIEEVSPGPHVELFARDARPGWDRWGNEVDSTPGVKL